MHRDSFEISSGSKKAQVVDFIKITRKEYARKRKRMSTYFTSRIVQKLKI